MTKYSPKLWILNQNFYWNWLVPCSDREWNRLDRWCPACDTGRADSGGSCWTRWRSGRIWGGRILDDRCTDPQWVHPELLPPSQSCPWRSGPPILQSDIRTGCKATSVAPLAAGSNRPGIARSWCPSWSPANIPTTFHVTELNLTNSTNCEKNRICSYFCR